MRSRLWEKRKRPRHESPSALQVREKVFSLWAPHSFPPLNLPEEIKQVQYKEGGREREMGVAGVAADRKRRRMSSVSREWNVRLRDCEPIRSLCVREWLRKRLRHPVLVSEACHGCCNLSPDVGRRMQRVLLALIRRPLKGPLLPESLSDRSAEYRQSCIPAQSSERFFYCVLKEEGRER